VHFRRKIFENHTTSPTPLTSNLLDRIAALYRIEKRYAGSRLTNAANIGRTEAGVR